MARRKIWLSAGILAAALTLVGANAIAQTKPAKAEAKTETGYVIRVDASTLVLSNIEPGSGGGPAGGPGGQGQVFTRTLERGGPGGGTWQGAGHGGGPGKVQLGPGDVVRGEDGKMTLSPEAKKRFTPEQQKMIQETLNSSAQQGGPVVVRRGPEDGQNVQVQPGKAAGSRVALQLTDFVLDKKTKSPRALNKGDKVKITYVEADGKKVATRIEKAK